MTPDCIAPQEITRRSGARYVLCEYAYDSESTGTTNFLLDLPWFFSCLWSHNVSLPGADQKAWTRYRDRYDARRPSQTVSQKYR